MSLKGPRGPGAPEAQPPSRAKHSVLGFWWAGLYPGVSTYMYVYMFMIYAYV